MVELTRIRRRSLLDIDTRIFDGIFQQIHAFFGQLDNRILSVGVISVGCPAGKNNVARLFQILDML